MEINRIYGILTVIAVLLLIPLISMQISDEVNWSVFDFVVAGVLLVGTGFLCEVALRVFKTTRHRVIACLIIFFLLLLIWAELAVGVFGTPFAGS